MSDTALAIRSGETKPEFAVNAGAVNLASPRLGASVTEVSDAIFSQYIVPFEAVSVLLLAALIGAIVVARKD